MLDVVQQSLEAKTTYVAHSGVIEDVAWHQHHTDIFGSVGDDKQLILWDTRKPPRDGESTICCLSDNRARRLGVNQVCCG